MTMINRCNGFLESSNPFANQCNGTVGAECPKLLVEEEEEFLMDTEEHRRILLQGQRVYIYGSLDAPNPACDDHCPGVQLYGVHRQCTLKDGCH